MKLSQRRKYVLYKLAFTHEVHWDTRPSWMRICGRLQRVDKVIPTLDAQDISSVMKSMKKEGLVRFNPHMFERPLHITLRGMDALLETVT
mgnify:CR=1 FL=1